MADLRAANNLAQRKFRNKEFFSPNRESEQAQPNQEQIMDIALLTPAPKQWNLYPLLKDMDKSAYLELKTSILTNGVVTPILVWHNNGKYIILSGHNRVDISSTLVEEYPEQADKWQNIAVKIYEDLTELEARSIIHQANIYRDISKIDKRTRLAIIIDRIEIMEETGVSKGQISEELMKELQIGKAQYYKMRAIALNLLSDLKELFLCDILSVNNAVALANASPKLQQYLVEKYLDALNNKTFAKIKTILADKRASLEKKKELIDIAFGTKEEKEIPRKKVSFTIEETRVEQTARMVELSTKVPTNKLDKFIDEYAKFVKSFVANNQ